MLSLKAKCHQHTIQWYVQILLCKTEMIIILKNVSFDFFPRRKPKRTARKSGGWRLEAIQYEIARLFNIFATLQPRVGGILRLLSTRTQWASSPISKTLADNVILAHLYRKIK
jgi:hypothetical protein